MAGTKSKPICPKEFWQRSRLRASPEDITTEDSQHRNVTCAAQLVCCFLSLPFATPHSLSNYKLPRTLPLCLGSQYCTVLFTGKSQNLLDSESSESVHNSVVSQMAKAKNTFHGKPTFILYGKHHLQSHSGILTACWCKNIQVVRFCVFPGRNH